jgi:hypothetical protein
MRYWEVTRRKMKILQEIEKESGRKKLEVVPSLPTGMKRKQWQMKW